MNGVGHPTGYEGFGSKMCGACLESGRGHVVMQPFMMRAVDEESGSLVYSCPRCLHQQVLSTRIPLEMLSRPAVKRKFG